MESLKTHDANCRRILMLLLDQCRVFKESGVISLAVCLYIFLTEKWGDISYAVPLRLKSGGGTGPLVPHRLTPMHAVNHQENEDIDTQLHQRLRRGKQPSVVGYPVTRSDRMSRTGR